MCHKARLFQLPVLKPFCVASIVADACALRKPFFAIFSYFATKSAIYAYFLLSSVLLQPHFCCTKLILFLLK